MKFPPRIQIGGHTIDVLLVRSAQVKGNGEYDNWYQTIKINIDDSPEDAQAYTFLHEIIEAINVKNEISLNHKQVTQLSEALFAVMRNNNLNFGGPIT